MKNSSKSFRKLIERDTRAQPAPAAAPVVTARVLFDGTHGLEVNTRRIRDQERAAISDLKRAMREKGRHDIPTFAPADVTEARQIPSTSSAKWNQEQMCTVTFGVASASYWSRVSAALGRLTQYMTWHMVEWRQVVSRTVSLCCASSSCALWSVCRSRGTRLQVANQRSGLASNSCTRPAT